MDTEMIIFDYSEFAEPAKMAATALGTATVLLTFVNTGLPGLLQKIYGHTVIPLPARITMMSLSLIVIAALTRNLIKKRKMCNAVLAIVKSGITTFSLSSLKTLLNCDEINAAHIAEAIVKSEDFPDAYYDPTGGILILTRKETEEYQKMVSDASGKELSPTARRSRETIACVQTASAELHAAIKQFNETNSGDKELKRAMKYTIKALDRIPGALSYNMEYNIDVHKIYEYYVPEVCQAIQKYARLTSVSMEESIDMRDKLLDMFKTTEQTFNGICRAINENDELDLTAQMEALQTIMIADGYAQRGLE